MQPARCLECEQLTRKFATFAKLHHRQGLRFIIGASAGAQATYAGTVEQFTIDMRRPSESERAQMTVLDCLTRPTLLITRGNGRLERVYHPMADFFSADAAFDQLLPHLIHTPAATTRH